MSDFDPWDDVDRQAELEYEHEVAVAEHLSQLERDDEDRARRLRDGWV